MSDESGFKRKLSEAISDRLQISVPTVLRWFEGKNEPHKYMQDGILDLIRFKSGTYGLDKERDELKLAAEPKLRGLAECEVEFLKLLKRHCICTRNNYGFDYGEKHPRLLKPAPGKRWLTPSDLIDGRIKELAAESMSDEATKYKGFWNDEVNARLAIEEKLTERFDFPQHYSLEEMVTHLNQRLTEIEQELKLAAEKRDDEILEAKTENHRLRKIISSQPHTENLLLTERIAELEKERDELRENLAQKTNHANALQYSFNCKHKKYTDLRAKLAIATEALEHYADKNEWRCHWFGISVGIMQKDMPPIEFLGWQKAREALSKIRGEVK